MTSPALVTSPRAATPRIAVPRGFRLGAVHAGLKQDPTAEDLVLILLLRPGTAAGVFTQSRTPAAPVVLDRARTPSASIRAVIVNAGHANACTGPRGDADAVAMTRLAADAAGGGESEALVLSTGVIGVHVPIGKIEQAMPSLARALGDDEDALVAAARGMMTTDTVPKIAGATVSGADGPIQITGLAKGAAMIAPNMATMLGVIMTDAPLAPDVAQRLLADVVDDTFNAISVDGHTSTNDTVLLLAGGEAGPVDEDAFRVALHDVAEALARAIPADGEGASHLVTIDVTGAPDRATAKRIARTIADSPLVKTAVAGHDPNWGRIISALGNAGVPFDGAAVTLAINGTVLYRDGVPVAFDAPAVSASMAASRDTSITLALGDGAATCRFWTTDLTAEYVRLNAEYHT